jgi:adenylylsulfate kinase-like enzyme
MMCALRKRKQGAVGFNNSSSRDFEPPNKLTLCKHMPLLVFCGYPASGKTTRATQVLEYLQSHGMHVSLIEDLTLRLQFCPTTQCDHRDIYSILSINS